MIATTHPRRRTGLATRAGLLLCAFTLTGCGGGGGGGITEPPKPDVTVATVAVSAPATRVNAGAALQLSATARNASGATLAGHSFSWQSSSDAVASVSASGLVTGKTEGPVTITASTDGKSASVEITVVVPEAARVAVEPLFVSLSVGGSQVLEAAAYDASDDAIAGVEVAWESLDAAVATVGMDGGVSGVSAGQARVVAQVDGAADTALVVVLDSGALLSTAFPGGELTAEVTQGQTVTVPVVLDLSQVGTTGDLGSAQLELEYDPEVLVYQSATAGVSGAAELNVPSPGTFKFSFAGTEPQGSATVTLATLTFQVAADALPGVLSALSLTYTEAPTSTDFESYALPVPVGGRIRVAAP